MSQLPQYSVHSRPLNCRYPPHVNLSKKVRARHLAESKKPESRGKKEKKSGPSWNTRLTKAELVLGLALFSEVLLNPWLYSRPELAPPVKVLIKMAIVAGCFGPLFKLVEWGIDH